MLAELKIGSEIASLVGPQEIRTFLEHENSEVTAFRRAAGRLRDATMKSIELTTRRDEKDSTIVGLPMYLLNEPIPLDVPETLNIICHFPTANNNTNSKINCDGMHPCYNRNHNRNRNRGETNQLLIDGGIVRATATAVREMAFSKFKRLLGQNQSASLLSQDYILKVSSSVCNTTTTPITID
jgi:hypothetical protein